ncbi:hypothetical protein [Aquibacillus salsiterrae]|uniref:Uncharacterized protein n=1 Tax=Aquibacillus salsiterrae TaxID=2950439 RepID=A0A9X3WE54_9BACI|nr:hypothetical protein [Aquibacillus salsiterrae]MDC3417358.1 hypothetical protein [Aquibacillus salsiterrae]
MILPIDFDKNELFVLGALVVVYGLFFRLPKRFPWSLTILIILFTATTARITDNLLSTSMYNLYDVMDSPRYDLFDLLVYLLYGPFGYFLVYYFDKWQLKKMSTVIYVFIVAVFSSLFERFSVSFHVFKYKGWQLSYSFSYYLVAIPLTLVFFYLLRVKLKK